MNSQYNCLCKYFIFIILFIFSVNSYAQEVTKKFNKNPRINRPFGLSFNLLGPTLVASVSLDCFIMPAVNVETGAGIRGAFGYWGFYTGPKYHFGGHNKHKEGTLYTGILLTAFPPVDVNVKSEYGYYIPIGLNNISKNGYTFSLEVAYNSYFDKPKGLPIWFALKFGYHFKNN